LISIVTLCKLGMKLSRSSQFFRIFCGSRALESHLD